MKRWLGALFLCLLMGASAAAAEEDGVSADWLTGVWRFYGGDTVCDYGFRLGADGTFTSYTTDGLVYPSWRLISGEGFIPQEMATLETVPPERLIPVKMDAIWRYSGGVLTVISEKGAFSYPLSAFLSPEGDDIIRLAEEAGGGFYQRGDESHVLQLQASVPGEVLSQIESFHPDYMLEGYAELADSPMGNVCFMLIRCWHGRMLHGFYRENGRWVNFLATKKAIPQIDMPQVLLGITREPRGYDSLWYDAEMYDYTYPEVPTLSILTANGEFYEEQVVYAIREDGLYLVSYGDHPNCLVDVVEDGLAFYNISYGLEGVTRAELDTNILSVDFYALPRHVADVRISGTGEPNLPQATARNALHVQDVRLREGKYPVYMGPGEQYGRAAEGKAAVSTNGWIQVFGEHEGWLLIHYAVSAEQYRFGWITADALAKGEEAAQLPFTFGEIMSNEEEIHLMDDPLNSRTPLLTLPVWTSMEALAQLGDAFTLVRVEMDGMEYWGFVYSWPLGYG